MLSYEYNPQTMRIMDTELASWLTRRYGGAVVLVKHCDKTTWSVALWLTKWKRLEDKQCVLNPHAFKKEDADRLDYLLKGPAADPRKVLKLQRGAYERMLEEERVKEFDARRYLEKKTGVFDPVWGSTYGS